MPWNPFGKKPKPDEFETLFRDTCARHGLKVTEIAGEQATVIKAGEPTTLFLANVRARAMNAAPADRGAILNHFVQASMSAPSGEGVSLDVARDRLMPRVGLPFAPMDEVPPFRVLVAARSEETKTARDPAGASVVVPAVPALHVNLVVDEAMTVWYVRQKHLDEWKTTFDALYAIALENLRRRSSPNDLRPISQVPGLVAYDTGDSYDAARLLVLKDIVNPWPQEGVIAAVPVRDLLLCVRLESLDAIRAMNPTFAFAHDLSMKEGYAITDQPLWFDGSSWEYVPVRIDEKGLGVFAPDRFVEALNRLGKSPTAR